MPPEAVFVCNKESFVGEKVKKKKIFAVSLKQPASENLYLNVENLLLLL